MCIRDRTWTLRNVTPTSQKTVNVQTAVNEKAALPTEVTLYYLSLIHIYSTRATSTIQTAIRA